jgi:hypothetical protein
MKTACPSCAQNAMPPELAKACRIIPLPPNSGPAVDIKAIEDAMTALRAGNRRGDAKNFAAMVTGQFVGITSVRVASKQDRIKELSSGKPPQGEPIVEQSSTRIYRDLAVTNRLTRGTNGRSRQTIIHARQGGKWLRAGVITTPVATSEAEVRFKGSYLITRTENRNPSFVWSVGFNCQTASGHAQRPGKRDVLSRTIASKPNQWDVFAPISEASPRSIAETLKANVTAAASGSRNRTWHCGSLTSRPSFTALSAT